MLDKELIYSPYMKSCFQCLLNDLATLQNLNLRKNFRIVISKSKIARCLDFFFFIYFAS